jgi:DNA-binding MarR family transcriptional regulator
MTGTHPRHDLDDALTHPVRFSILAALHGVDRAEFALIRDSVEVSDAALSKQVALLERAGYVDVDKGRVGRRTRTWLKLTASGDAAYRRHVDALQAIAGLDPRSSTAS